MARTAGKPGRTGVDHGSGQVATELPGHALAAGSEDFWDVAQRRGGRGGGAAARGGRPGRWPGSGGRWWIWIGRLVLWAFILVVIVNGIRAPFERFTTNGSPGAPAIRTDPGAQFPTGPASAYALQFASVYLNYDQRNPGDRAAQLSYFLPDNADPQFGWDSNGAMAVQTIQVAGVDAKDANNAIVTLLVKANGKWLQLAVPVYAKGGGMVISGKPALLPPLPRVSLPQQAAKDNDTDLVNQIRPALQGFFQAYAVGDDVQLSRFSLQGGHIPANGLNGAVGFVALGDVNAPRGAADQRVVTATVTWQLGGTDIKAAPAKLDQVYQVTVVKKDGTWYVKDIRGATP